MVVSTYSPSCTEGVGRRIMVQVSWGKNTRSYLKNNQCKKQRWHGSSGRVPNKFKALSSNPTLFKKLKIQ
jgi:hypothetical protein